MLEKHLAQLFEEMNLGQIPTFEKERTTQIVVGTYPIQILKLESSAHFSAAIAPLPTKDPEDLLLKVMTAGGVLGLKEDESSLTLSLSLPYEMNYKAFKDAIEEFVNYIEYWKTEVAQYKEMQKKPE
jgi:hypothetical protein